MKIYKNSKTKNYYVTGKGNDIYIVKLALVEGESLYDYFNREQNPTLAEVKAIAENIEDINDHNVDKPDTNLGILNTLIVLYKPSNFEIIKYLVDEKGADINKININNMSLLKLAISVATVDIIEFLIDREAIIAGEVEDFILNNIFGINNITLKIVKYMVEKYIKNIEYRTKTGDTILLRAIKPLTSLDILDYLIDEKGANINTTNENGEGVLFKLLKYVNSINQKNMFTYLINKGVDINITDKNGDTVLFAAIKNDNLELINYIIDVYKQKGIEIDENDPRILKSKYIDEILKQLDPDIYNIEEMENNEALLKKIYKKLGYNSIPNNEIIYKTIIADMSEFKKYTKEIDADPEYNYDCNNESDPLSSVLFDKFNIPKEFVFKTDQKTCIDTCTNELNPNTYKDAYNRASLSGNDTKIFEEKYKNIFKDPKCTEWKMRIRTLEKLVNDSPEFVNEIEEEEEEDEPIYEQKVIPIINKSIMFNGKIYPKKTPIQDIPNFYNSDKTLNSDIKYEDGTTSFTETEYGENGAEDKEVTINIGDDKSLIGRTMVRVEVKKEKTKASNTKYVEVYKISVPFYKSSNPSKIYPIPQDPGYVYIKIKEINDIMLQIPGFEGSEVTPDYYLEINAQNTEVTKTSVPEEEYEKYKWK